MTNTCQQISAAAQPKQFATCQKQSPTKWGYAILGGCLNLDVCGFLSIPFRYTIKPGYKIIAAMQEASLPRPPKG